MCMAGPQKTLRKTRRNRPSLLSIGYTSRCILRHPVGCCYDTLGRKRLWSLRRGGGDFSTYVTIMGGAYAAVVGTQSAPTKITVTVVGLTESTILLEEYGNSSSDANGEPLVVITIRISVAHQQRRRALSST